MDVYIHKFIVLTFKNTTHTTHSSATKHIVCNQPCLDKFFSKITKFAKHNIIKNKSVFFFRLHNINIKYTIIIVINKRKLPWHILKNI